MMKQEKQNPEIRAALASVLDYIGEAEKQNFEENGRPQNHIYRDIVILCRWLGFSGEGLPGKGQTLNDGGICGKN